MDGIAAGLEGRAAIVTGAGSRPGEGVGNGRAAAILLARAGARVVLADTQGPWAEETRRMIAEEGAGEGVVAVGDVTRPKDCRRLVEAALDRYARAFPKAGLPFLRGAAGPEAQQMAVELLDRAVAKGRPLDHWVGCGTVR